MLGSQQWTGKMSEDSSPMRGLGRLEGCPGSQLLTLKVLSQCDGEIAGDPGCLRPYAGAASVARLGCVCCKAKDKEIQSSVTGKSCDDAFPVVAAEPNLATLPE
jgi:hypothetical protein